MFGPIYRAKTEAVERPTFIYGLIDPDTATIRYVGKTHRGTRRILEHYQESCRRTVQGRPSTTHLYRWLDGLLCRGAVPLWTVLEYGTAATLDDLECKWISQLKDNCRLVNTTTGGDGIFGLPVEVRRKMSEAKLGKPNHVGKYIPIGTRFGYLTVVALAGRARSRKLLWLCQCDCGVRKQYDGTTLRSAAAPSCGCRQLAAINRAKTHCRQGHPYDERNTGFRNGERTCRRCAVLKVDRQRKKKRAQRERNTDQGQSSAKAGVMHVLRSDSIG